MKTIILLMLTLCVIACSDESKNNTSQTMNKIIRQEDKLVPITKSAKKPHTKEDLDIIPSKQDNQDNK